MSDEHLFHKYDLGRLIENQRETLRKELDGMQDSRLLNTDLTELQSYAVGKYTIHLPVLGDPVVDESRTKMEVGRYGGYSRGDEPTVLVDAQRYTLEVPFEGDKELFFTRGSTFNYNPPRGQVRDGMLTTTIVERNPSAEALNQQFDRFLADIRQHLGWLKNEIDSWNSSITSEVAKIVEYRRQKSEKAAPSQVGLSLRSNSALIGPQPMPCQSRSGERLPINSPLPSRGRRQNPYWQMRCIEPS
jgi:hypothetical protein